MKNCFDEAGIKHANWKNGSFNYKQDIINWANPIYPIIAKHRRGSRGTGNFMINNESEFNIWLHGKILDNYIFEKYHTYNKEYRLHVSQNGCFYTCRKVLKNDTPQHLRFQRHDDNSAWLLETNPSFDKPVNWNDIINDCVKALKVLQLDFAAFDIKVQSTMDKKGNKRTNPEYIIIESNSAPSMGTITLERYLEEIPKLLKQKHEQNK